MPFVLQCLNNHECFYLNGHVLAYPVIKSKTEVTVMSRLLLFHFKSPTKTMTKTDLRYKEKKNHILLSFTLPHSITDIYSTVWLSSVKNKCIWIYIFIYPNTASPCSRVLTTCRVFLAGLYFTISKLSI